MQYYQTHYTVHTELVRSLESDHAGICKSMADNPFPASAACWSIEKLGMSLRGDKAKFNHGLLPSLNTIKYSELAINLMLSIIIITVPSWKWQAVCISYCKSVLKQLTMLSIYKSSKQNYHDFLVKAQVTAATRGFLFPYSWYFDTLHYVAQQQLEGFLSKTTDSELVIPWYTPLCSLVSMGT